MSELWIPQPGKTPDITNIFDMMVLFQEKLDTIHDPVEKQVEAIFALKALTVNLKSMDEDEKRITLVTDFAIIDDTEDKSKGGIVEAVGIDGLIDEVHCIQVNERLPWSVSLGLEAFTIFPAHDPESADIILSNAKTPIISVRYIETLAS